MNLRLYARCLKHSVREPSFWLIPALSSYRSFLKIAVKWYIAVPPFGFLSIPTIYALAQLSGGVSRLLPYLHPSLNFAVMLLWPLLLAAALATVAMPFLCVLRLVKTLSAPHTSLLARCDQRTRSIHHIANEIQAASNMLQKYTTQFHTLERETGEPGVREQLIALRFRAVNRHHPLQQALVQFEKAVHDTFYDAELLAPHITADQEQRALGNIFDSCAKHFLVISTCKQSIVRFEDWREPTLAELIAAPYIGMQVSLDPTTADSDSILDSALDHARESQLHALGISDEQLFATS